MDQPLSSQDIIRTSLIVGAVWILVGGVSTIASSFANLTMTAISMGTYDPEWIGRIALLLGSAVLTTILFAALPGWLLLSRARRWSLWLSESDENHTQLPASLAYGSGLLILGIYFGVSGAASLLGGSAFLVAELLGGSEDASWFEHTATLPPSIVYLISGWFIYRAGSQAVVHAA